MYPRAIICVNVSIKFSKNTKQDENDKNKNKDSKFYIEKS